MPPCSPKDTRDYLGYVEVGMSIFFFEKGNTVVDQVTYKKIDCRILNRVYFTQRHYQQYHSF